MLGGDTYAYTWVDTCASDTDSDVYVHNASFRKQMADGLAAHTDKEQGGFPWMDPNDSTFTVVYHPNKYAEFVSDTSPCTNYSWDLSAPSTPLHPPPGSVIANIFFHEHVYADSAIVPVSCGVPPNTKAGAGPSIQDRAAAVNLQAPGYIVQVGAPGKPGYLYRFNGPHDGSHSRRWKLDADANGTSSCFLPDNTWKH